MRNLWIVLSAVCVALPALATPKLTDGVSQEQKPPRMIIIRTKVQGEGKEKKESEAQVMPVTDMHQRVTNEETAKQALRQVNRQNVFQISEQTEQVPEAIQTLFSVASKFAHEPLEGNTDSADFHRWHYGRHLGYGNYFYGYGTSPYYGYNAYYPYAYPAYGYYHNAYYYPYTYSYAYPVGGYNYYYYYNPYYAWP
jgi:hypothetical protein